MCAVRSSSLRPHGLSPPACFVHGISRQEYWSGLPFPSPGDLPNSGIKPVSLVSSALAGRFFATNATWEARNVFFSFFFLSTCYDLNHNTPCQVYQPPSPLPFFGVRSCGTIFVFNFVGSLGALISAAVLNTEGTLAFPRGMLDFHVQLQR